MTTEEDIKELLCLQSMSSSNALMFFMMYILTHFWVNSSSTEHQSNQRYCPSSYLYVSDKVCVSWSGLFVQMLEFHRPLHYPLSIYCLFVRDMSLVERG